EIDPARIDDDYLRAFADALLHTRSEHRMRIRRVGAADEHDVAVRDRVEILCAGRSPERGVQAITGRRMADARAGVDIVVAEGSADHLLNEVRFLIRAARGGDTSNAAAAIFGLDALEFGRRVIDRLVPRDLFPGLGNGLADHRLGDAFFVCGIAPGKAA